MDVSAGLWQTMRLWNLYWILLIHQANLLAGGWLYRSYVGLQIQYHPGTKNQNADALSRLPIPRPVVEREVAAKDGKGAVNALVCDDSRQELGAKRDSDPSLQTIKHYLWTGELPTDEQKARKLVLSWPQFEIVNDVLYHVESDKTLQIIPPVDQREKLFEDTHSGLFGGHLRSAKIHSQLVKHFWWPTMRADIVRWCRACQVCATRQVGKPIHPFLSPIPVSAPFDQVGVDVIQFPPTSKGNRYAIVFMDYLTKWPEVFPSKN